MNVMDERINQPTNKRDRAQYLRVEQADVNMPCLVAYWALSNVELILFVCAGNVRMKMSTLLT